MYRVVSVSGVTALQWVLVALFTINFSWIALAFTSAIVGFLALLLGRRPPPAPPPSSRARTAVVMPVYNEATARVFASLQAMNEEIGATGLDAIISTSSSSPTPPSRTPGSPRSAPSTRCASGWARRRASATGTARSNVGRKAGNIEDFVTRWGGAYEHMLVLDADSLMTGECIMRLAAAMEADPDAGIIQSLPLIINRNTLFARLQQFAAKIYGPVIATGLAVWSGREGNYWGHNAIIRTRGLRRPLRHADAVRQAALRRPHPEPRLRRGGADPPRRLDGLHAARPRRQLRGEPALADRPRHARPALVPGQPAAHRA